MRLFFRSMLIMGLTFSFSQGCSSQEKPSGVDRQPAVAGRFYPGDPSALRTTLQELFRKAEPSRSLQIAALISPHAGYVFSGQVAASAYNQLDPDKAYKNVFILASSHHISFPGASVYNQGDYLTPLGKVKVNRELANELIGAGSVFTYNPEADLHEHSLEVQVPFLQYQLKQPFQLVPIILGTQSPETCKEIAQALKPWLNEDNLFVISTDFSHYPTYEDAITTDKITCDAIASNDPETLLRTLKETGKKKIPGLSTGLCGWTSVLTLLYMTSGTPGLTVIPLSYMNSGDSRYGERSQVVGYWSMIVTRKDQKTLEDSAFSFSLEEKKMLLNLARTTVEKYVTSRRMPEVDTSSFTPAMKMKAGAFVTLKKNGELRGCIGKFTSDQPLYEVIRQMAVASATEDTRFLPVSPQEFRNIEVEISVLSPMKRVHSAMEVIPGRHGIYMKKGYQSGTFLPQVATETGWTREEFLGHCARDKAGISWDGWKTAELYTYEACVFSEHDLSGHKDR